METNNCAVGGLTPNAACEEKMIEILDTTLRDGAQAEGVNFSVSDKLSICRAIDDMGVGYIEAGNPGSNPKDEEFFEAAKNMQLKSAKLTAFCSTKRKGVDIAEDAAIQKTIAAGTGCVAMFGKVWDLHVDRVLGMTLEENLCAVSETVAYFKQHGKELIFDAEHFFDGYKANAEYAMQVLAAADDAGADVLCLCDTNGAAMPDEVFEIVSKVKKRFPAAVIGIHCHNDTGCAVANSMLAVRAGATHVHGTFNGIGERCGNANLCTILPNLQLKWGYKCVEGNLRRLRYTANRIAEIANVSIPREKPYVGRSAFAHKGGMHIDGVDKITKSFEHVNPETVGNKRRFLLSEVSGKRAVLLKIADIKQGLSKDSPEVERILKKLKEMEHSGYQFEAAEASFEIMVKRELDLLSPHFVPVMYKTGGEFPAVNASQKANAMIQIEVGESTEITAAVGDGPIHALDQALRKALCVFYPELMKVHLIDYKVRVLEADNATGSAVRVLIESSDGERKWTTVGASTDIIEASFLALVDSFEYKLSSD